MMVVLDRGQELDDSADFRRKSGCPANLQQDILMYEPGGLQTVNSLEKAREAPVTSDGYKDHVRGPP
jgi:hypothetical protein